MPRGGCSRVAWGNCKRSELQRQKNTQMRLRDDGEGSKDHQRDSRNGGKWHEWHHSSDAVELPTHTARKLEGVAVADGFEKRRVGTAWHRDFWNLSRAPMMKCSDNLSRIEACKKLLDVDHERTTTHPPPYPRRVVAVHFRVSWWLLPPITA